jgi:hypothetical protein
MPRSLGRGFNAGLGTMVGAHEERFVLFRIGNCSMKWSIGNLKTETCLLKFATSSALLTFKTLDRSLNSLGNMWSEPFVHYSLQDMKQYLLKTIGIRCRVVLSKNNRVQML